MTQAGSSAGPGVLRALLRDPSANTLIMVAGVLMPLLAMVGGGIDMGRGYLSETRLQQACDAGVLAARKKLGSSAAGGGTIPAGVASAGNAFFNSNFRDGSYGTTDRSFQMTLQADYSISGVATVKVPTTIMQAFGFNEVALSVDCEAQLNFRNTDIMMVLDTTGSMNETNSGDDQSRIDVLKDVVATFHTQLEGSKTPGVRIRYGFVPYSTNVNVGELLDPDWVVDEWTYQGRVLHDTGTTTTGPVFDETWDAESGTQTTGTSYSATGCPADTVVWQTVASWTDPNGVENTRYLANGTYYSCSTNDSGVLIVTPTVLNEYTVLHTVTNRGNRTIPVMDWTYQPVTVDVSGLKRGGGAGARMELGRVTVDDAGGTPMEPSDFDAWFRGCIEERSTYEITDYAAVDLTRALDLDLDRIPDPANPATQWRPMLNELSWVRSIDWGGRGTFSIAPVDYQWDYLNAGWGGRSACPAPAQKLAEMNSSEVTSYVDTLVADGNTYHDIGMIWGGRLISKDGLFASENADEAGRPTQRHLIFLTDGQTATRDVSYGTYGIEPLDTRRWSPSSTLTLTQTVENRFTFACNEVKRHNVTVWVIGFGTEMTDMLKDCAGNGRWFQANDAATLNNAFSRIAASMGDLRISR